MFSFSAMSCFVALVTILFYNILKNFYILYNYPEEIKSKRP